MMAGVFVVGLGLFGGYAISYMDKIAGIAVIVVCSVVGFIMTWMELS